MRLHARKRIAALADNNSFHEWYAKMKWYKPLGDDEYAQKLVDTSAKH